MPGNSGALRWRVYKAASEKIGPVGRIRINLFVGLLVGLRRAHLQRLSLIICVSADVFVRSITKPPRILTGWFSWELVCASERA